MTQPPDDGRVVQGVAQRPRPVVLNAFVLLLLANQRQITSFLTLLETVLTTASCLATSQRLQWHPHLLHWSQGPEWQRGFFPWWERGLPFLLERPYLAAERVLAIDLLSVPMNWTNCSVADTLRGIGEHELPGEYECQRGPPQRPRWA